MAKDQIIVIDTFIISDTYHVFLLASYGGKHEVDSVRTGKHPVSQMAQPVTSLSPAWCNEEVVETSVGGAD